MRAKEIFKVFLDAVKGKEQDYTKGSLRKSLFLLAIPIVLEMVMESLFAIVDIFFVAQVSNNAIATVGNTEGVLMLIESVAIGIAMGATALIARRVGEKKTEQASDAAVQAIFLASIVAIITGVLAFLFAEDILRLLCRGNEGVVQEGKNYTRIILGMNIILMYLFVFNGIFRAAGNPAIAMRTLWISNGLNIVLDPIFIFGIGSFTGMGVTGAAVATCIGRGTGVLYQFYILLSGGSVIRLYKKYLKPNFPLLKSLFNLSLGGAGQFLIATASWIFLIFILNDFGEQKFSGYTIAIRVVIFSILPSWGLAMATATLVGQNLGANEPDRAEKTVWKACRYNMIYLVSLSVIFLIFGRYIIEIFTQDQVVIDEGVLCLKIICLSYIFFSYQMIILQAFNGAGDTRTPTWLSFIFMWLVQIPLAYVLAQTALGTIGVYIAICVSSFLITIASIVVFRQGKWKEIVV